MKVETARKQTGETNIKHNTDNTRITTFTCLVGVNHQLIDRGTAEKQVNLLCNTPTRNYAIPSVRRRHNANKVHTSCLRLVCFT